MKKRVAVLGIDLQNDFTLPSGSLYVKGADEDIEKIVSFVKKHQSKIDYIALTLDSHQPIHIAHQCYWRDEKGNAPALNSVIKAEDVKAGKWYAQYHKEEALSYLEQLEANGDMCIIWPMHCILGTNGWAINPSLMNCLIDWSIENNRSYELLYKGYAQNTEHYSIFRAAVEWEEQPETQLNKELLDKLNSFDELILVGEAADFCVANSLDDRLQESSELTKKIIILSDCMSWIIKENPGAKKIFEKAKVMGVRFIESQDY